MEASIERSVLELTALRHRLRPAVAAKLLNVTRSRVDRAIARLQTDGLVLATRNPHDARSTVISLTDSGVTLAVALQAGTTTASMAP